MKGGNYSTIDNNFSGSSPSNSGGEEDKTPESINKEKAIERAKQLALDRAKNNVPNDKETRESLNEKVQSETRPETKLAGWNPNSKWAGPMRIVQAIGPARRLAEKFVSSGNRYSDEFEINLDDEYGFLGSVGSKIASSASKAKAFALSKTKSISNAISKPFKSTGKFHPDKVGWNELGKTNSLTGPKTIKLNSGNKVSLNNASVDKSNVPKVFKSATTSPSPMGPEKPVMMNKPPVTTAPVMGPGNGTVNPKSPSGPPNSANVTSASSVVNKPTVTSKIGNTLNGIAQSKVKSALAGAAVGAGVAMVAGRNPVAGAAGGAALGAGASHIYTRNYSRLEPLIKMNEFPELPKTGDYIHKLERDKLLIDGYGKELNLIDKVEANESPKGKDYYVAKKLVSVHLSKQRDAKVNLKGSREFLLKKLSNPKDERMYSSLNLLYFYCDRN